MSRRGPRITANFLDQRRPFSDQRRRPASEYSGITGVGLNKQRTEESQQLLAKSGQLESEQKQRKEAEERCKQLSSKIEHLQAILNKRNENLEQEKNAREEAERSCQSLQMTISKLEEYLRKKNTINDQYFIPTTLSRSPNPSEGSFSLSEVARLQNEIKEKDERFQQEIRARERAESRCAELEEKLKSFEDPQRSPATTRSSSRSIPISSPSPRFRDFEDSDLQF